MRLDKYLKVSRIIKRRTVANEACDAGKVVVNGKVARASYDVKVDDVTLDRAAGNPFDIVFLHTHKQRHDNRAHDERPRTEHGKIVVEAVFFRIDHFIQP